MDLMAEVKVIMQNESPMNALTGITMGNAPVLPEFECLTHCKSHFPSDVLQGIAICL